MGEASGIRSRRTYNQQYEEEDEETSNDDLDDNLAYGDDRQIQAAVQDREEELVESALARVRRARAKGKKDVNLSQEELLALERRKQRIRVEEERKKRQEREKRFAVPISQLEPTIEHVQRRRAGSIVPEQAAPYPSGPGGYGDEQDQVNYPPMGVFPPPLASTRSRQRSGTASSQRPASRDHTLDRSRGSSPFRFSYVQRGNHPPSASRHVSDGSSRPQSRGGRDEFRVPSYGQALPASISAPSIPNAQRYGSGGLDPFQYMDPGTPYPPAPIPGRRNVSNPALIAGYSVYAAGPVEGYGSPLRRQSSGSSGDTASEEGGSALAGSGILGDSRRVQEREVIIIEDSPEPIPVPEPEARREPERPASRTKKSSGSDATKRKPAGGRRRKGR
ncbi:hypothetical protein DL546_008080 [Coniochaeta pulveracea]|uniref:Prenylated Rab acceptor 1 n=1 Tax=Coniochaeta pulveracea TaxID=177199 RepID=A0A420YE54_9PEZI|nr:hypothetical protein DL546_008080 [Coniochaeta pulveracea]